MRCLSKLEILFRMASFLFFTSLDALCRVFTSLLAGFLLLKRRSTISFKKAIAVACLVFWIHWRKFQRNPTRLLCRLANSPNFIAYRMHYWVFSMIVPLLAIILLLNRKPPYPGPWYNRKQAKTTESRRRWKRECAFKLVTSSLVWTDAYTYHICRASNGSHSKVAKVLEALIQFLINAW